MIRRSFNLPDNIAAALNHLASQSGTSPNLLVTAALTDFLSKPIEIDGATYPPPLSATEASDE